MRRGDFWRWLVTRHHFWLNFAANALAACTAAGFVPQGIFGQAAAALYMLLGLYGYGAGAKDMPPRRPWSADERAAHGLPPSTLQCPSCGHRMLLPEAAPTHALDVAGTDPDPEPTEIKVGHG